MYAKRTLLLAYPWYQIYLHNFYKINDIESFPSEYREGFNPVPEELLTKIDVISVDVTKGINDNTAILLTDGTSLSWNDIVVYFEIGDFYTCAVCNEHPFSGEKNSLIIYEDYSPTSSIFYNYPIENFNEFKFFTNIHSINVGGKLVTPAFNEALKNITIPNSCNSIDSYAFCSCPNLTTINIPNSVTYIGSFAFDGCSNLTTINIPNSVKTID
jgi:hypothetical protein